MTDKNHIIIMVWPDGSWASEEDVDDMNWYLCTTDKADNYKEYEVPTDLDPEDIDELIELRALPGIIPDKIAGIEDQGKVQLPDDAIIVIDFPPEEIPFITSVTGKMIINTKTATLEILKGK